VTVQLCPASRDKEHDDAVIEKSGRLPVRAKELM